MSELILPVQRVFLAFWVVLPGAYFLTYLQKKLTADLQARVGPKRSGPAGVLQPLANTLKMLQKLEISDAAEPRLHWLLLSTASVFATLAVLPLGPGRGAPDNDFSVLLPLLAILVSSFCVLQLGVTQSQAPGWFGGLRLASQSLAGAVPGFLAITCASIGVGGFKWSQFVALQGAAPWHWLAAQPLQFLAFIIFILSGMISLGLAPLDGPYLQQDLQGGVISTLAGNRVGVHRFRQHYGFFLWSTVATVIFLGAWTLPQVLIERLQDWGFDSWVEPLSIALLLIKSWLVMLTVLLVSSVIPSVRSDQATDLSWRYLIPFALGALTGTVLLEGRVLL